MDVHLRSTTVCALDAETGEAVTRRFRGNPWGEVAEWMWIGNTYLDDSGRDSPASLNSTGDM